MRPFKPLLARLMILMTVTLTPALDAAGEKAISLSRFTDGVIHAVLPNGFVVVLKNDPQSRVTAVHLRVKTGSIHEEGFFGYGLSHFFEHSMFLGSQRRPVKDQFAGEIESYGGGNVNAYTTLDHTAYLFTVFSEYTEQALDCMEDLVLRPLFPTNDVANEMGSIMSEMDMRNDQPESAFNEMQNRMLFSSLPYKFPIIGLKERFATLNQEQLLAYYKARYVPNNMILSVVGHFDTQKVLKTVERLFGPHPSGVVKDWSYAPEPPLTALKAEFSHPKATFARVSHLYRTVDLRHPDMYPLDVLASLLANGKGSYLHDELKDKESLVESVGVSSWTPEDTGVFEIGYALPVLDKASELKTRMEAVDKRIEARLAAVARGEIDGYRLESLKRELLTDFIGKRETALAMAASLASSVHITGGVNYDALYLDGIQKVTVAEVARVARTYLAGKTSRTAFLLPPAFLEKGPLFPGSKAAAEIALGDVQPLPPRAKTPFSGVGGKAQALGKILGAGSQSEKTVAIAPVAKQTLANGLTVLYQRDSRLPQVSTIWLSRGGLAFESGGVAGGSHALMARLLRAGTDKYPKDEFTKRLKAMGADLNPITGKVSVGFGMKYLKDRMAEGADLMAAVVQNTGWEEPAFEVEKKSQLFGIVARRENGWANSGQYFRQLFYAGTPFARMEDGDEDSVRGLTLSDLKGLKAKTFNPADTVVAIYGDLTDTELEKNYLSWMAKIPAQAPRVEPTFVFPGLRWTGMADIKTNGQKGSKQTYLRLAYRVPGIHSPDAPALKVLDGVLSGMGGPIFKLRSEPFKAGDGSDGGRAYQIGCSYEGGTLHGTFSFYVGLRYEARLETKWAVESFQKALREVMDRGVTEEELKRGRSSTLGQEVQATESLYSRAMDDSSRELAHLGFSHRDSELAALAKVTAADVKRVARTYFSEPNFLVHALLPE